MSASQPARVSLMVVPDAAVSTLSGMYDVLTSFKFLSGPGRELPMASPFDVAIVGEKKGPIRLASNLSIETHRSIDTVRSTDIVIVPSLIIQTSTWPTGRYPKLVKWLTRMGSQGSVLCSACSGLFLLGETGAFDHTDATIHWSYADLFRRTFPNIPISPEKVLVVAGEGGQLVSSGASTSWHDLVLYLIARQAGPAAAQAVAHFFALQWHRDGLAPYVIFDPPRHHGDAAILGAQDWLATNYPVGNPVEQMARQSKLALRTFKRRFTNATQMTPITYVQRLRVEEAKRRLERTPDPVDEISWQVGYEDPASFHRLFKRLTGLSPGSYRRQFQVPEYAAEVIDR